MEYAISIHALREEGDQYWGRASLLWCISIHALREEGDTRWGKHTERSTGFLSTPSARRATRTSAAASKTTPFLSTPSARRATEIRRDYRLIRKHFYPRPPRGGRLISAINIIKDWFISIHALREEGDPIT